MSKTWSVNFIIDAARRRGQCEHITKGGLIKENVEGPDFGEIQRKPGEVAVVAHARLQLLSEDKAQSAREGSLITWADLPGISVYTSRAFHLHLQLPCAFRFPHDFTEK